MSTLVERASAFLDARTSRRGFLARVAVVGSAAVVAPAAYALRPGSAYGAVCGPAASCGEGYTVFCCTIFDGANKCPPGSFVAGWWKADYSSYCCTPAGRPGPRYYIDCQGECTKCSSGCGRSPFCDRGCVDCACSCGDSSTCDQRKVCCNYFRYGQCHQEIACSGPVTCRVVTCVPPYELYDSCGDTPLTDNYTAQMTAPCLNGPCA